MSDIFRLFIVLVIILLLLRRKWNVGYVMLIASVSLVLFYLMGPGRIFLVLKNTITAPIAFKLLIALTFIRIFEFILRDLAILDRMMGAMKGIVRNKKAVVTSMPLLIGILPSVGGAYFSAPMVDEATKDMDISLEEKAFANYWYRHPWEFILPLYPGIILASALTAVEVRSFIALNFSYALTMFVAGFWWLRSVSGSYDATGKGRVNGLWSFLPIAALLLIVIAGNIELHHALLILVFLLIVIFRYPFRKIRKAFIHGFSRDVIILIFGVMVFKETLEVSGSVGNISRFFTDNDIPIIPVLFLLPFITGFLTGLTVGFVGSTFPLIYNIAGSDPYAFTFAFASGYIGVLLSPVHVCLILTREYFKANMMGIYRKTVPASMLVFSVALVEFFLLRVWLR